MIAYKRTLIIPRAVHTVTRYIPGKGRALVKVGQRVKAYEIVGFGEQSVGFRSLNLSEMLGIDPREVPKYLLKNIGAFVYQGETLAKREEYFGLRQIEIQSPIDGIMVELNARTGVLNLEYLPKKIKVPAGVEGEVSQVSEVMVRIKARVAQIYGVAGAGKLKEGSLKLLGSADLPLRVEQIKPNLAGKIIVGGSVVEKEVLYKCLAVGVKGIITGGINFTDYQDLIGSRGSYEEVGLGVLVMGGFGNFPIHEKIYAFFQKYNQQPAMLYGVYKKLLIPEFSGNSGKIINKEPSDQDALKLTRFGLVKKGQRVRLLTTPHLGLFGIIKKLGSSYSDLPSGVKTRTVVVELEDQREIEVGVRNIEIIKP